VMHFAQPIKYTQVWLPLRLKTAWFARQYHGAICFQNQSLAVKSAVVVYAMDGGSAQGAWAGFP
jgi:hypothetical protein